MRCFQFSYQLSSWVWKVKTGWRRFLSWLHHSKLFVLKNELHYFLFNQDIHISWSRWEACPGGTCFLGHFFILFYFVLWNSILLTIKHCFFSSHFTFYYIISFAWSYLRVLITLPGFAGALFLKICFSLVFYFILLLYILILRDWQLLFLFNYLSMMSMLF